MSYNINLVLHVHVNTSAYAYTMHVCKKLYWYMKNEKEERVYVVSLAATTGDSSHIAAQHPPHHTSISGFSRDYIQVVSSMHLPIF